MRREVERRDGGEDDLRREQLCLARWVSTDAELATAAPCTGYRFTSTARNGFRP